MPRKWHSLEHPSGVLKDSIHVAARRVIRLFHFFRELRMMVVRRPRWCMACTLIALLSVSSPQNSYYPWHTVCLIVCLIDWLTDCSIDSLIGVILSRITRVKATFSSRRMSSLRYVFSTPWCRCSGPWPCWSQWHTCDLDLVKLGTGAMDVGGKWKVISEARYDFCRSVRSHVHVLTPACLSRTIRSCILVCDLCQNSMLPSRALRMDRYIWCIIHKRKHVHPITNIFLSIYHRHQKNIYPHPNICRHRTSIESISKKSCMHFSLEIYPFIHLWQPMESPSTMSQTEVCHFDCSGSGNVPKRSWRLKWEPPGITCKVSISWYLSRRAWIMHDHCDMNLIFATCQTCCMFDWSSTLKVWRVHQEVRMFSQWITICRKHSPHSWNIMKLTREPESAF